MHLWSVMQQHIFAVRVNVAVSSGELKFHLHAQQRYAATSPTISAFNN